MLGASFPSSGYYNDADLWILKDRRKYDAGHARFLRNTIHFLWIHQMHKYQSAANYTGAKRNRRWPGLDADYKSGQSADKRAYDGKKTAARLQ